MSKKGFYVARCVCCAKCLKNVGWYRFKKWAFVFTHNHCCFNACVILVSRMRSAGSIIATVNKPQRNVLDMSGAFFWADLLSMTVVFTCNAKQNRHQTTER